MCYRSLVRPLLFSLPPETAHELGLGVLRGMGIFSSQLRPFQTISDPALRVTWVSGPKNLTFENPVGLAAGFDKNAVALSGAAALGFGFMEAGTLTPRGQPGNPLPRIFRLPDQHGLINRLGFNNEGVSAAAQRLQAKAAWGLPVGFNIGKNKSTPLEEAAADYEACVDALFPWADFFVVNVSSPNTPQLRQLQSAAALGPLLRAVRQRVAVRQQKDGSSRNPFLFVKLSPDEDNYEELVDVVLAEHFDGVVATNTTRDREGMPNSAPSDGGLSGQPLRQKSTQVLRRLTRAARGRLIVIGVGGIFSAEDAYEKILAGASAVEIYTGFIYEGPGLIRRIQKGLLQLLARDGFKNIHEAVGQK